MSEQEQKQQKEKLTADVCYAFLLEAGKPMHNKDLLEIAVSMGLEQDRDRPAYNRVWLSMEREIKRLGDEARFRFLNRGLFVAKEYFSGDDMVFEKRLGNGRVPTKEGHGPSERMRREPRRKGSGFEVPERDRSCGNCRFITFSGPGRFNQLGGGCNRAEDNGRWYVKVQDAPCHLWSLRTRDQRAADKRERDHDLVIIDGVNAGLSHQRRR
jgi:hypothetical protein